MSFVVCQGPPQQVPSYHGMLYVQRSHTDCILISGNGANADEGTLYVQVDLSRPGARLPYEQVREALVDMLKNEHAEPYEMGTEQLLNELAKICEVLGANLHLTRQIRGKREWRCTVDGISGFLAAAFGDTAEDVLCRVLTVMQKPKGRSLVEVLDRIFAVLNKLPPEERPQNFVADLLKARDSATFSPPEVTQMFWDEAQVAIDAAMPKSPNDLNAWQREVIDIWTGKK